MLGIFSVIGLVIFSSYPKALELIFGALLNSSVILSSRFLISSRFGIAIELNLVSNHACCVFASIKALNFASKLLFFTWLFSMVSLSFLKLF